MYRDMMIDLETLSTRSNAVMLSIGVVLFTADQDEHNYPRRNLYALPSVDSQIERGFDVQADTVKWWFKQSQEARAEFHDKDGNLPDIKEVLMKLTEFYLTYNPKRVWSHGATFDIPILITAYEAVGLSAPWHYWACRDTRTLFDLLGEGKGGKLDQLMKPKDGGAKHNALADAENQANAVNYAWRKLKGGL